MKKREREFAKVAMKVIINGKTVIEDRNLENFILVTCKENELNGEEADALTTMAQGHPDEMHQMAVEFLRILGERGLLAHALMCYSTGSHQQLGSGVSQDAERMDEPLSTDEMINLIKKNFGV